MESGKPTGDPAGRLADQARIACPVRRRLCSRERWADYQMFGLRAEIAQLEAGVARFLRTTQGRFETWLAARQVRTGS